MSTVKASSNSNLDRSRSNSSSSVASFSKGRAKQFQTVHLQHSVTAQQLAQQSDDNSDLKAGSLENMHQHARSAGRNLGAMGAMAVRGSKDNLFDIATVHQRKRLASKSMVRINELFNLGMNEKIWAEFEEANQFLVGFLRAFMASSVEFRNHSDENGITKKILRKEDWMQWKPEAKQWTRSYLEKLMELLYVLPPVETDPIAITPLYQAVIKQTNDLVSLILNCNNLVKEDNFDLAAVSLSNKIRDNFDLLHAELALRVRDLVANQLCRRFTFVRGKPVAYSIGYAEAHRSSIQSIFRLRELLTDDGDKAILMQGTLHKRSKNDSAFSRTLFAWKKFYFILHSDSLIFSEKQGESSVKTIKTDTFHAVEDVSDDQKRKFSFEVSAETPLILSAASEKEYDDWISAIKSIIKFNKILHSDGKSNKTDWSIFTTEQLREILKSYDRQEKFLMERTKLSYLQKMKDIISKMEMIENGSTMITHDATIEIMEKLKEYDHEQKRNLTFRAAINTLGALSDAAKVDPEGFLAFLSGLPYTDFI